jgi:hypothetical protein
MGIRVAFWNIENFRGNWDRLETVTREVAAFRPDIFCFCEITDKATMRYLVRQVFDDYDFGVSDGTGRIELLVGWRRNTFDHALFTQRREFQSGNQYLRPGALLSVMILEQYYTFLFMHADSGTEYEKDYKNRQEMFENVWKLKSSLKAIEGRFSELNFMVIGDLNTMGHNGSNGVSAIDGASEIAKLREDAAANGMRLLDKTHDRTLAWDRSANGEYKYSNLDHMLATENMKFKTLSGSNGVRAPVRVRGWVDVEENDQSEFIEKVSDHTPIHCEVEVPED